MSVGPELPGGRVGTAQGAPSPEAPAAPARAAPPRPGAWNVVVTVRPGGYAQARRLLADLGAVHRTPFFNVLVMHVEDGRALLEELTRRSHGQPWIADILARVVPSERQFTFQSPEAFEEQARATLLEWVGALEGRSFHVRMHRRGFASRLSRTAVERRLSEALLEALERRGRPGRIEYADPDAVIAIETVGPRAGLALYARDDLRRWPLLRVG